MLRSQPAGAGLARWLIVAAVLGFLGVAAGAFGAHALAERFDAARLAAWETAARYQMFHALALLAVAWLSARPDASRAVRLAGWAFAVGTAVFCGALYTVALSGARWPGMIAPVGGLLLLLGWAALAGHGLGLARHRRRG